MHPKKLLVFFFVLYLLKPVLGFADSNPIQVQAENVEYFHAEQKVVGTGHVSIDYEGTRLLADKITVKTDTQVAVAEGHVRLVQKGVVFEGESAEYNFKAKSGNVSRMKAFFEPSLFGRAQKIERVSDKHFRATDSYVTTCCSDTPFYKFQAHQIDVYPDDKIVIRNAVLYVNNVPVLFIPYYVQPYFEFDRFPVQIVPGQNSEWGGFVLTKWRYHLIDKPNIASKGNILVDYRSKRGVAGGIENYYRADNLGRGSVKYYLTDDRAAPEGIGSGRYRTQARHQSRLTQDTTLTFELNKLSDADIIKDFFFRDEHEKDVFPDNYVSLITAKPEYTFSILDRERLDPYFTVVERSPELRFDTHHRQLFGTPFYFREEMQFANLRKAFAFAKEEIDALRGDSNLTLTYAGHLGDLSVAPHVGTRQTLYSRDVEVNESRMRGIFDGGVDLSTHFFKTYDWTVKAWGLDYNQIRHIFTPTASYNYRPNPTVRRELLQQFDSIDALDKQNFIRLNFENKIQTKEHDSKGNLAPREIARLIPFFDVDLHRGRVTNLGLDAELRPYSWLGLEGDIAYDPEVRHIDTANFDLYLDRGPFRVGVGQRYLRDESTLSTAQIEWRVTKDLAFKVYNRFDFAKDDWEEIELTVSKGFDCGVIDFTFNHKDEQNDNSFYASVKLNSFPERSYDLDQSYRRPKAYVPPQPKGNYPERGL